MSSSNNNLSLSSLIPHFQPDRILNQDQLNRRLILHGTLASLPTILILERTPLPSDQPSSLTSSLTDVSPIGQNDIYSWHLASTPASAPDVKLNLIHPCTDAHVQKYSAQGSRVVTETPAIYRQKVRPWMERWREEAHGKRLTWVWNILEERAEMERVLLRVLDGGGEGFVLVPDLNWDGKTLASLHLLALVERRDIWSIRDLKRSHVRWLEKMRDRLLDATTELYEGRIERDQLKLYLHYQPTYYHLHIHIVNVALEAGATQATGKAFGLENLISQLRSMDPGQRDDDEVGMADVDIIYTIGEGSELWMEVFGPLKARKGKEEGC